MAGPNADFWQQRFRAADTPWDRGAPHPQLHAWLASGVLASGQTVLVPGCGSGHEVAALARAGVNATGIDYTPEAVALATARLAAGGLRAVVREADVLAWQPAAPVDAVYEQTCLCALHPDHWTAYAAQLHRWLRPGGRLCALFMQAPRPGAAEGRVEGPPYHGDINAMRALFPSSLWDWPAPPYAAVPHARGWAELAVVLQRR
jgi:SAM-dependent methyltransferase